MKRMKDMKVWNLEEGVASFFVVYERPKDYPEKFVVRRFVMDRGTDDFHLADSLEEARESLPPNLLNMGRCAWDDPVIVEVWF